MPVAEYKIFSRGMQEENDENARHVTCEYEYAAGPAAKAEGRSSRQSAGTVSSQSWEDYMLADPEAA